MPNLLSLFARWLPQSLDPERKQRLLHAIKIIDPRLQAFGNYPRAYLQSVEQAYSYAEQLAARLPEPILLSPRQFASDPLLHAIFSDVSTIHNMVRESREIKQYCHRHGRPEGGELFALMGMRRHEKVVFGRELRSDEVQQDVQQTMVYFEAHTLSLPVAQREEFDARLLQHLFDSLLQSFRGQISDGLQQKREMEVERDILIARGHSHQPLNGGEEARLDAVRRELARLEQEYVLSRYPAMLADFVERRQEHLRLEQKEIPIDMRGVQRESDDRLAGRFTFYDLIGRDRRRWTLYPVRLPVDELSDVIRGGGRGNERWMQL